MTAALMASVLEKRKRGAARVGWRHPYAAVRIRMRGHAVGGEQGASCRETFYLEADAAGARQRGRGGAAGATRRGGGRGEPSLPARELNSPFARHRRLRGLAKQLRIFCGSGAVVRHAQENIAQRDHAVGVVEQ